MFVCTVAAGFPSGQFPLHSRIAEIYHAVATGAHEIDVVIDRTLVRCGLWTQLYSELSEMRKACGQTPLKVKSEKLPFSFYVIQSAVESASSCLKCSMETKARRL